MGRSSRILSGKEAAAVAAPPPEAVAFESDFVVILAVLLCALICVVGLIAAARCAFRRHRNNSTAAAAGVGSFPLANKGLKKKVLQSLPKFTYSSTTTTSTETIAAAYGESLKLPPLWTECPICLGEFMEGEEVRMLPSCGHGFHVACIDKWLGSHSSCPSCRQVLVVGRCGKCGHSLSAASGSRGGGAVAEPPINGGPHANVVNNAFLP